MRVAFAGAFLGAARQARMHEPQSPRPWVHDDPARRWPQDLQRPSRDGAACSNGGVAPLSSTSRGGKGSPRSRTCSPSRMVSSFGRPVLTALRSKNRAGSAGKRARLSGGNRAWAVLHGVLTSAVTTADSAVPASSLLRQELRVRSACASQRPMRRTIAWNPACSRKRSNFGFTCNEIIGTARSSQARSSQRIAASASPSPA
jgi:hypothetical protein